MARIQFSLVKASVFVFFVWEISVLKNYSGVEEFLAIDWVSVKDKPCGRRDLRWVSVETLEVIDFFLGPLVSISHLYFQIMVLLLCVFHGLT